MSARVQPADPSSTQLAPYGADADGPAETRRLAPGGPAPRARRWGGRGFAAATLLAPGLFLMLVLRVAPVLVSAYLSLTEWDGLASPLYVGLDNYRRAFEDPTFRTAILNTLKLFAALPLWLILPFCVAALVYERVPFARLARFTLLIPVIVSPAILGLYFSLVLSKDGPINSVLGAIGLGFLREEWLANPNTAFWSFLVILLWTSLGVNSLFYSAAFASLDPELMDAAAIDGAGVVRRYRHIVVPHVAPVTKVIAVFTVIILLTSTFPLLFTLTGGGPANATTTFDMLIYQAAYVDGTFGYSCALAVITVAMIVVALVLPMGLVRAIRRFRA